MICRKVKSGHIARAYPRADDLVLTSQLSCHKSDKVERQCGMYSYSKLVVPLKYAKGNCF